MGFAVRHATRQLNLNISLRNRTTAPAEDWASESFDWAREIERMLKHETSVSFSYSDLTPSLLVVKATSTTLVTQHAIWARRLESDGSYLLVPRADGKGHVIRTSRDIDFRTWVADLTAPDA